MLSNLLLTADEKVIELICDHTLQKSPGQISWGSQRWSPWDDGIIRKTSGSVVEGFSELIYNPLLKNKSSLIFMVGHHFSNNINILKTASSQKHSK